MVKFCGGISPYLGALNRDICGRIMKEDSDANPRHIFYPAAKKL
jgi:hypothetical protein